MGQSNAKEDAQRYRDGYPGDVDEPHNNYNLDFYSGKIRSVPDGDYIDDIHAHWFGKYDMLEEHHGYIQWIFPIREEGMNHLSHKLQIHEAQAMAADKTIMARFIKSYKLMLDFYGLQLKDETTGEVERAPNYKSRFRNLNFSGHNYLRITRILKCLGELGLEHWKIHLCKQFIEEAASPDKLLPNIVSSLIRYWIPVLKVDADRAECAALLQKYNIDDEEDMRGGRFRHHDDDDSEDEGDDSEDTEEERQEEKPRKQRARKVVSTDVDGLSEAPASSTSAKQDD